MGFASALVIFAHESQLEAVATSLVAIVLMALVGAWRQRAYGNLRLRDGVLCVKLPRSETAKPRKVKVLSGS